MSAKPDESSNHHVSQANKSSQDQRKYTALIKPLLRVGLESIRLGHADVGVWPSAISTPERQGVQKKAERLPPIHTLSYADQQNKDAVSIPLPDEKEGDILHLYQYTPLSSARSIRIVQIDEFSSTPVAYMPTLNAPNLEVLPEIQCSLLEVTVDNPPPYVALSYTWGTPQSVFDSNEALQASKTSQELCCPIKCDGKAIMVTPNLYDFLLRHCKTLAPSSKLRGVERPQYFWIDAICIDQSALRERSNQVPLMYLIYEKATQVHVWLGELDTLTRPGFDAMEILLDIWKTAESLETLKTIDILSKKSQQQVPSLKELSQGHWLALYAQLTRHWFFRAWIIQEVVFAREVLLFCGSIEATYLQVFRVSELLRETGWGHQLERLAKAAISQHNVNSSILKTIRGAPDATVDPAYRRTLYASEQDFVELPTSHLVGILDLAGALGIETKGFRCVRTYTPSVLEVLSSVRKSKATDPRDKIIAFLRFLGEDYDFVTTYLAPDYGEPVETLYIDTARYIIESQGSLELLSHLACKNSSHALRLPSWVPDWSVTGPSIQFGADKPDTGFMACANLGASFSFRGTKLHTKGIFVDRIAEVAKKTVCGEPLSSLANLLLKTPKFYPNTVNIINDLFTNATDKCGVPLPLAMMQSKGNDLPDFEIAAGPCQSRIEAFWRTLLIDICDDLHPAPLRFGYAFCDWLKLYLSNAVSSAMITDHPTKADIRDVICELLIDIVQPWGKLASEDVGIASHSDKEQTEKGPVRLLPPGEQDLIAAILSPGGLEIDFDRLRVFQKQLNRINSERRIYRTQKGLLGNCFPSVNAGDEIWVLAGMKAPVILRRVKGTAKECTLLGESYVHGIMHGEAVLAALKHGDFQVPCTELCGHTSESEVCIHYLEHHNLLQHIIIS